jgi:hypothetical protein
MRTRNVGAVLAVVGALLAADVSARANGNVQSFGVDQNPLVAGSRVSFTVAVTDVVEKGGASVLPFVELSCVDAAGVDLYRRVAAANSPVSGSTGNTVMPIGPNAYLLGFQTQAYFALDWSPAVAATCAAVLFVDGWVGDIQTLRPRKNTTLATLEALAVVAP